MFGIFDHLLSFLIFLENFDPYLIRTDLR